MSCLSFDLVTEGTTELFVHKKKSSQKGPSSRTHEPFYNPAMELNRDLSLLVNQWLINSTHRHVHLVDGLAASGIRGIRFSHELTGDFDVTVNDRNEASYSLIQQNIRKNAVKNIIATQKDLNLLLSEQRYHSIDIDPFGSPVFFVDAAVRSIYNKGIIACTATDTATLCGVFPKVCYRRYGSWPLHAPCMHEIGLRILIGFICREAAKYDRGIEPLLCYTTDHYLRFYVQIVNGKHAADRAMEQFHKISSTDVPLSGDHTVCVGPLWLGKLQKTSVLQEIRSLMSTKQLHTKPTIRKLLLLLEEEADAPPFFYTTDDLCSFLKQSPPCNKRIFERLKQKGFIITKTHCTPTGFKTNAPFSAIKEVFK